MLSKSAKRRSRKNKIVKDEVKHEGVKEEVKRPIELTRADRVELAKSNLNKYQNGEYRNSKGLLVNIKDFICRCNQGTILYKKYPTLDMDYIDHKNIEQKTMPF